MELNETEEYSEIILEDEYRALYITATKSGLDFYCKDKTDDETASYMFEWSAVPELMEKIKSVVDKWLEKTSNA